MALTLARVAYNGNIHGRYVADVYSQRWQKGKHGGHFTYTTYRYTFRRHNSNNFERRDEK